MFFNGILLFIYNIIISILRNFPDEPIVTYRILVFNKIVNKKYSLILTLLIDYVILVLRSNRVTGCVGLILLRMGVMPMKNHFDFKDMMTLGLSLLA